ncbi:MAG: hypothetical protein U0599_27630 [Vicinamibacteria bacterium]
MTQGDPTSPVPPLGAAELKLTTAVDAVIAAGALGVLLAWFLGRPIGYSDAAPVMSPFTALSLFIMVGVRQARLHYESWPVTQSLALTGLVLGGNVASIALLFVMPPRLQASFPGIVLTSAMTALGLVLFCLHDLVVELRDTPDSAFIVDDVLVHLALVPGGVSLLGYLLANPTYLSVHADPRIGISVLEMGFMALYAAAALVSNPRLFLWRFLAGGWGNRLVFAGLFANQFVAPVVVGLLLGTRGTRGAGIELYVMVAGVVTTISFLLLQAHLHARERKAAAGA